MKKRKYKSQNIKKKKLQSNIKMLKPFDDPLYFARPYLNDILFNYYSIYRAFSFNLLFILLLFKLQFNIGF